jgi:alpha-L-rhamnosidase
MMVENLKLFKKEKTMSGIRVHKLTCNYLINPLGIDITNPFFSWQMKSNEKGAAQTAYQIQVAGNSEFSNPLWETGWVVDEKSVHVQYSGQSLESMTVYYWRVRVKDQNGAVSEWSEVAHFETGLELDDWQAKFIEPEHKVNPKAFKPAPFLRSCFESNKVVDQARLYITSHGLYEAYLNGQRVGDWLFTPGNTDYNKRLQYQVYDVSGLIRTGENCMGVILGDGWYRGSINSQSKRNSHGTKVGVLCQLQIKYTDGSEQLFCSDGSWKTNTGPIVMSDMKKGEVYDARLEMPGWAQVGFDDSRWENVLEVPFDRKVLITSESVPVKKMEVLEPVGIIRTPKGETVIDFGQNIAGYVIMQVKGTRGDVVKLTHSEVLDKNGNFTTFYATLPAMYGQKNIYTLKGDENEIYEPHFTVHGFRYVKLEGYPGKVNSKDFTAVAIYSAMEQTGYFDCSNEKINQLHNNTVWSMKGNFLDIPTDCPTRERAGWTGDAQVFVHTGSLLMNDAAFYAKWIKDVASQQYPNGMIRNVVPDKPVDQLRSNAGRGTLPPGSSGWGDAMVIIPWTLYEMFGDKTILEAVYGSMKKWVEYERENAKNSHWTKKLKLRKSNQEKQELIWDTKYHLGEWLEPDVLIRTCWKDILRNMVFSDPIVATAYYENSVRLLGKAAGVLGKKEDEKEYLTLADDIKMAYINEFINEDGTTTFYPDRQAPYVRAINFGYYTEQLKPKLLAQLIERIKEKDWHLFTGFLSTPFLLPVLSDAGRTDIAYKILTQEDNPSWLYAINKGATTIWEDWEGINEKGAPTGSHNHYSKGAVVSWLYEYLCGIQLDPETPAYQHFFLMPTLVDDLSYASASFLSPYGEITSKWEKSGTTVSYQFTIPANTSASVRIENVKEFPQAKDTLDFSFGKGVATFDLNSGSYEFVIEAIV